MNMRRLGSVMRKEIAQILRDKRTLGSILMLPIIQLVLYGYLSNDVAYLPMVVWDQSKTAESRDLIQMFLNTRYFTVREYTVSMRGIQEGLDGGRDKIGMVIPPEYGRYVRGGIPTEVMVVVDASDATTARQLLGAAGGVGQVLSQRITLRTVPLHASTPRPPPVDVRARAWYNPDLSSQVFLVPGVLAVILQFTTTFLSISTIVRERELGTFEQIVVTPITQSELMLGKILPLVALGYINMTFILGLGLMLFGVSVKGSLLLLYAVTMAFFFSSLGLGTLISTMSRTFQQASQLSQLILLPSILISGFLFPRETLPRVLQWLGDALPLTYFVTVVRGIVIKGVGMEYLWRQIIPLFVLGVVVFALAVSRFQKKLD